MRLRFKTKREAESFAVGLTYTDPMLSDVSVNEEDGYWLVIFEDESESEDEGKDNVPAWGLREDRKLPPLVPAPTSNANHCPWCGAPRRIVEYVLANSKEEAEYGDSLEKHRTTVFAPLGPKETAQFLAGKNAGYWVGVTHILVCKTEKEKE